MAGAGVLRRTYQKLGGAGQIRRNGFNMGARSFKGTNARRYTPQPKQTTVIPERNQALKDAINARKSYGGGAASTKSHTGERIVIPENVERYHFNQPSAAPKATRVNSHEMRMDDLPTTRSHKPETPNSYGRESTKSGRSYSGGGSGPVPPAPTPPGPPTPYGPGLPARMHGPAHNIPEHANPKGAHSVMSEVGPGARLWGQSMYNMDQAGGLARLGTSAVRGAMLGGVTGGVFEGATGGDFWEGAKSGAMYGGLGAGARRGVRSMSGAKKGQGTLNAMDQHIKSQYPQGWSKSALAMVKNKEAAEVTKKANGLK